MKQLLIIAMLAFGMNVAAQTNYIQKDSLTKCEQFHSRVKFAVEDASDSLMASGAHIAVKKWAYYATVEHGTDYYYMPFVRKIVRKYPAATCSDADLRRWVIELFDEVAIKPVE